MARHVVLGNPGSGKSTLAARLARTAGRAHLDCSGDEIELVVREAIAAFPAR